MHQLPLAGELYGILGLTIGLVSVGLFGFVALQRYGILAKLPQFSQHLGALDKELMTYYTSFRRRFVGSVILHFIAFTS